MTVTDVQPSTPSATSQLAPLTFTIQLTNKSAVAIPVVTVSVTRGDPITTQSALDSAMHAKQPASPQFPVPDSALPGSTVTTVGSPQADDLAALHDRQ